MITNACILRLSAVFAVNWALEHFKMFDPMIHYISVCITETPDLIGNSDLPEWMFLSSLVSISVERLTIPYESHFLCWFQRVISLTFLHLIEAHWQLIEEPKKKNYWKIFQFYPSD